MHANHNRFWGQSGRLVVNYLFDVFGVLWNIESEFEFYVICVECGQRFAVDIWQLLFAQKLLSSHSGGGRTVEHSLYSFSEHIFFATEINLIICRKLYTFSSRRSSLHHRPEKRLSQIQWVIFREFVAMWYSLLPTMMLTHIIKCD